MKQRKGADEKASQVWKMTCIIILSSFVTQLSSFVNELSSFITCQQIHSLSVT